MPQFLIRLWAEDRAQNQPEYALLLLLICLTAVSTVGSMAAKVNNIYFKAGTRVAAAENKPSLTGGTLAYGAPPPANPRPKSKYKKKLKPAR